MSALLRRFIAEVVAEAQDYRVPNQLRSPKGDSTKDKDSEEDADKEEVDEMAGGAGGISIGGGGIAGFTAPLGASSEDLKGPGAGRRRRKASSARWK